MADDDFPLIDLDYVPGKTTFEIWQEFAARDELEGKAGLRFGRFPANWRFCNDGSRVMHAHSIWSNRPSCAGKRQERFRPALIGNTGSSHVTTSLREVMTKG